MLVARLSGGRGFVIGVDDENIRRLKKGQPIQVDFTNYGGTDRFLLMHGATLSDVAKVLETATGQKLPVAQPIKPPTTKQ